MRRNPKRPRALEVFSPEAEATDLDAQDPGDPAPAPPGVLHGDAVAVPLVGWIAADSLILAEQHIETICSVISMWL